MFQKAEEIQNLWRPKQCDFIINFTDMEEGLSFCKPAESSGTKKTGYQLIHKKINGPFTIRDRAAIKKI